MKAGRELDALVEEHVMEKDLRAVTNEEVGRAVFSGLRMSDGGGWGHWKWNGTTHLVRYPDGPWFREYGGNHGYGVGLWGQRIGKLWQADIEAHVAAWREKPAPRSTSIASAWEVVEKMREQDRHVSVYWEGQAWEVEIGDPKWRSVVSYATADTAPHAMCIAALRAVGVEVPDEA